MEVPFNEAQGKLFQQIEAGLADLSGKRESMLLMVLAGAGHAEGAFGLKAFDFEKGTVTVQLQETD